MNANQISESFLPGVKLNSSKSQCVTYRYFLALVIIFMFGFTTIEFMFVIAGISPLYGYVGQSNSKATAAALNNTIIELDSNENSRVLIRIESNGIKIDDNSNNNSAFTVSSQDFWKIFGPMLELAANRTSVQNNSQ